MQPAGGAQGRILRLDLSTGTTSVEEPPAHFVRTYLGGWGTAAYYLLRELPAGADPLGPDNLLVFAAGVLTGAPFPGTARSAVGARSPLTGGFGCGEVGGWWGAELKRAGFDAIVIRGRAESPVYLWVHDGAAEIRPAGHLWGHDTLETEALLREELGDGRVRVAQIGQAGERLARIAAVMHDVTRAAGRGGLGAVMGAKRLKAVAVRGTGSVPLADSGAVSDMAQRFRQALPQSWGAILQDQGTAMGLASQAARGGLPTRNFGAGSIPGWEGLTGERLRDTILQDRAGCFACPVRCKRVAAVEAGPYPVDPRYGGPEYETIAALGPCCGVTDLAAIARAGQLCNAYGLDTISTGAAIAWAMECRERELLTGSHGGPELSFGDAASMLAAVEAIGERQGLGDLLAEGAWRAAQQLGPEAQALVPHVKGQEIPMHEPRIKRAMGLGYAVSPTGADHNHNLQDTDYTNDDGIAGVRCLGVLEPLPPTDLGPAKVRLARALIPWNTLVNALGMCAFVAAMMDRPQLVDLVHAVTGWDTSLHELHLAGERVYTLARAFNAHMGLTAADDTLPARFFEPLAAGPAAGQALDRAEFARALRLFYQMMGWDERTGAPLPWKLHELGLSWLVDMG